MNVKPTSDDYLTLIQKYEALSNGDKASIRREVEPDDLKTNPVFYRLIQGMVFADNLSQSARLIYFLPFAQHKNESKKLGVILQDKDISERRLFIVVRSEYPNDLTQLRRVIQQIKPYVVVNYPVFGNMLFHWGKSKEKSGRSKQRLMQDFYLSASKKPERTQES